MIDKEKTPSVFTEGVSCLVANQGDDSKSSVRSQKAQNNQGLKVKNIALNWLANRIPNRIRYQIRNLD